MTGATFTRTPTLALGALVLAGALAAQTPPAAGAPQAPRPTAAQAVGGGTAQYLVENPGVLHLTPVQEALRDDYKQRVAARRAAMPARRRG